MVGRLRTADTSHTPMPNATAPKPPKIAIRAPLEAAISPPPVAGPRFGFTVSGDVGRVTENVEAAVWPLAQLRFTVYVPGLVVDGTVTLVWSFPLSGTSVTVPNTFEVTMAGFRLSPQVALSVMAKPASIVLGVMSRIVDADAGVAGRSVAANANDPIAATATSPDASPTAPRRT
jgi:hypothetical protein